MAVCGRPLSQWLVLLVDDALGGSVKRILLTGMSGTGKSTVIGELVAHGHRAIDMDEPGWSEHAPDGDWIWREDRIREALAREEGDVLFVSGCATNQVQLYPQFDAIVLFSAPAEVLIERLATRTNNPYGKHPDELAEVLGYLDTVEPRLRRSATHEIDTRAPLGEVVAAVLRLSGLEEQPPPRGDG
jgi:shikimate kinase